MRPRHAAVFLTALILFFGACSHAHVSNPRHKWMPLSHAVLGNIGGGEISNDLTAMAVGAVLIVLPLALDAATLPFHGLGHLFASGGGKPPDPAGP